MPGGGIGGRLFGVAFAAALILCFGVQSAGAVSATGDSPTVTIVTPQSSTVHLTGDGDAESARFVIGVNNTGSQLAGDSYRFQLIPDQLSTGLKRVYSLSYPSTTLSASTVTPVTLNLRVYDSRVTSGTLVLDFTAGGTPASLVNLTFARSPRPSNFRGIVISSISYGLVVFLLLAAMKRRRKRTGKGSEGSTLWTPTSFSFSGSIATTITAAIAAVGAVFSATGVLADLIPGIDASLFLGVNLLYGVVLTTAPLVYSAMMKTPSSGGSHPDDSAAYGTKWGYVMSSAIISVAVGGQVSTAGALVWISDLDTWVKFVLEVLLTCTAVIFAWYIASNYLQLEALKPARPGTDEKAPLVAPGLA